MKRGQKRSRFDRSKAEPPGTLQRNSHNYGIACKHYWKALENRLNAPLTQNDIETYVNTPIEVCLDIYLATGYPPGFTADEVNLDEATDRELEFFKARHEWERAMFSLIRSMLLAKHDRYADKIAKNLVSIFGMTDEEVLKEEK